MIELAFVACSLLSPYQCKEQTLTFDVPIMQCMTGAQVPLSEWVASHPGWRVDKYECRAAGRFAKI